MDRQLLKWLKDNGCPTSYATIIVHKLYNMTLPEFLVKHNDLDHHQLLALMNKYEEEHIPIPYLLNEEYFLNDFYYINQDVLIPRIESEELVMSVYDYIKEHYQVGDTIIIADVCCGCGVLGISLKLLATEFDIKLYSCDISAKALEVCKTNYQQHGIEGEILLGDLLTPLIYNHINPDIIIINPPYVPTTRIVDDLVKQEPNIAIFSGEDGLDCYREFYQQLPQLNNQPVIFGEIDITQNESIKQFSNNIKTIKDIGGLERFFIDEQNQP